MLLDRSLWGGLGREVGGSDGFTSHFLVTIELERLYPCLFTLCVASSVMCPVTVFTHLKKKNALSL